jgi:hypothetical protein
MGWVKLRSSKPRAVSMPTSASSPSWSRCCTGSRVAEAGQPS